ncbi:MAG: 23S rRNA (pseudouridine(1915)-N(3))-methyltransferase RlmH [Acidobacteriota bacterium]|jgi:23S rRNA (pseudouridine1915-N3)-methyltransferase|nr:23S rRNA (pseudouridine(1915)-N(3))-methyltransferase RlmH [Acidobacteriota bacterium]
MKLKAVWIGKTKSSPIRELAADYLERIRRMTPCEIIEIRDPAKGRALCAAERIQMEGEHIARQLPKADFLVALDETGKQYASEEFACWLETEQNSGTKEMAFIIGGPDGLSRDVAARARMVLSLGKMTWTHEMCRALLLEQLYRALCILHKIPYHK